MPSCTQQSCSQMKTLFSTSIQVLETLISQYQTKFTKLNNDSQSKQSTSRYINDQCTSYEVFQKFYQRLKTIFQVCQQKCFNTQRVNKNYTLQSLDLQNFNRSYEQIQRKSDDQLYQLVVQLKDDNNSKNNNIKRLAKQIKQKNQSLKLYQQQSSKHKQAEQLLQNKIKHLQEQINQLNNSNQIIQNKLINLVKKYQDLNILNQKVCFQLQQKCKKLQNLKLIQTQNHLLNQKSIKLSNELIQLRTSAEQMTRQISQKTKISQQKSFKINKLEEKNGKLIRIINEKLSFLEENNNKQNIPYQNVKKIIENKLKDQQIISPLVEKQLTRFLAHVCKNKILQNNKSNDSK